MPPFRFLVDAAHYSSGFGTGVSFTRGQDTVDPSGTLRTGSQPRFDRTVALPSIPPPWPNSGSASDSSIQVYSNSQGRILAAGVDTNGTTELMVYLDFAFNRLFVFSGGTLPNDNLTLPTLIPLALPVGSPHTMRQVLSNPLGVAYDTTSAPPGKLRIVSYAFRDLFTDADRPFTSGGKAIGFEPFDGTVFHGLIVLSGRIFISGGLGGFEGRWPLMGMGFAVSNDKGATWSLAYYDIDDGEPSNARPLWPRGRQWCQKVAALYSARAGKHPIQCFVSGTDYKHNIDPLFGGVGHAYCLKFDRTSGSAAWTVTPSKYARFTLTHVNHCHSAQVTEYGSGSLQGLQLIVSSGDSDPRNRFTRFTLDNKDDPNFGTAWSVQDDYHGTHVDTPVGNASLSQQPVSALQGGVGTILWGSDDQTEWITQMSLPTGSGQCSVTHVYGVSGGAGPQLEQRFGPFVELEDLRPENAGIAGPTSTPAPAIGILSNDLNDWSAEGALASRVIYTPHVDPDGGLWAQVAATPWVSPSATSYGGHLYFTSEVNAVGMMRRPVPEIRTYSPVLVAPGGTNLIHTGCGWLDQSFGPPPANPGAHGLMESISGSQSAGFVDSSSAVGSSRTLHPPCYCNQIFRLTSSVTANFSGLAGQIPISSDAGGSGTNVWSGVRQIRRFRVWLLNGSYNLSTFSPNKTAQVITTVWPDTPDGERRCWIRSTPGWGVGGQGRWCPATIITYNDVQASPLTPILQFFAASGRETTDDNYVYVALDQAMDGIGTIGYPMLPTSSPTAAPNEMLTVSGFSVPLNASWLIRVAEMMPTGNWDQYAMRGRLAGASNEYVSERQWPLLTLWGGANLYVELLANCETRGLDAVVKLSTTDTRRISIGGGQVWISDAPLYLVIGYNSSTQTLYIGFSLGGELVELDTLQVAKSDAFTELRFRGPQTGTTDDGEVCEMRVIGGEVDGAPTSAPTEESIRGAFGSLSFLNGP